MSTKAKPPVKPATKQICLDIRKEQLEALEKIRATTGGAVAFQIRNAIDQYLKSHNKTK